jgi:hypothetical protein
MPADVIEKEDDYILNHCAKYLARDNTDERHSFFGLDAGQDRARISDAWRFPVIDADDSNAPDASEWNHVTFVYRARETEPRPSVKLLTPLSRVVYSNSSQACRRRLYLAITLRVSKGQRHRYRFIADGEPMLDCQAKLLAGNRLGSHRSCRRCRASW